MISLGLDIGSNSVGSAWVDIDKREICLGASVFPAGVDETDSKRGSPLGQKRREKRSQRRSLARRAARRHTLRTLLTHCGLLPSDLSEMEEILNLNPWFLRRKAISEPLTPYEFGRVLIHLNQRRGALGVTTDPNDKEEGKVKEAIDHTRTEMQKCGAKTFGHMIADLMVDRSRPIKGKAGKYYQALPVRNRRDAFEFHADRVLIRDEFELLWAKQKTLGGPLSALLTDQLRNQLDESQADDKWRHKGVLFGQRKTYWDTGTLGRCDLEPTEHRCPVADMYGQEYRVVEFVNNIRIEERGKSPRSLSVQERLAVIEALRTQKTGSIATVRTALGINRKTNKEFFALNIERDPDRKPNADWFYCQIIVGVFGANRWSDLPEKTRNDVNHAILKFDPEQEKHVTKLHAGAICWWGLDVDAADRLIAAWKHRPRLEQRLSLSRKAIRNLMPYMNQYDETNDRWPTQIEARKLFANDDAHSATAETRNRYEFGGLGLTKADRRFLRKHPGMLPPAPMLSNPVVRKAIHEVRRHILAYRRRFERNPDRIVIELARSATQPESVRNEVLAANRKREAERRKIIQDFNLGSLPLNQQRQAIERVTLCVQQRFLCAYTGDSISPQQAADGTGVEVDHLIPWSRSQNNSLNNKVLCKLASNRMKGNATPREWLSPDDFARMQQRFDHWKSDCPSKWENLHRDPASREAFINSQLTDTAYAARQVGQYLRDALYGGERDGRKRVFFTKGKYTAILRRDWGLLESLLDGEWHKEENLPPNQVNAEKRQARLDKKDRSDHRHHAIDALVIALTDTKRIHDLAQFAELQEKARAGSGKWPKRQTLAIPWGTDDEFRRQALAAARQLVVAHRPVKRRIKGFFHKETLYGPVFESTGSRVPDRATIRQRIYESPNSHLKAEHLRLPIAETREQFLRRTVSRLRSNGMSPKSARSTAEAAYEQTKNNMKLVDPSPGKSGIIRDLDLRMTIRKCLSERRIDPDDFSAGDLKDSIEKAGPLRHPSGVPILSAVLLWANSDPIVIQASKRNPITHKMESDCDPRRVRLYDSQNNHHIEIREHFKSGRWFGQVVNNFEAAKRVRTEKKHAVDKNDNDESRFVMSLAEGETVYMLHPDSRQPSYFVVFKLDKPHTVHFIHHWDARASKAKEGSSKRNDIPLQPERLKLLGVQPGQPPQKVWVSPLGETKSYLRD